MRKWFKESKQCPAYHFSHPIPQNKKKAYIRSLPIIAFSSNSPNPKFIYWGKSNSVVFLELKILDVNRTMDEALSKAHSSQDVIRTSFFFFVYRWCFFGWLMVQKGLPVVLKPHDYRFRSRGKEDKPLPEHPVKILLWLGGSN